MRKLFGLILLVAFIFPFGVGAQGTVRFSSVEVEIWPEYDRPEVLVIYRLSLAGDVTLPVELSIRIPLEAEINAVATSNPAGTLMTAEYDAQAEGEWTRVTFSTSDPRAQIEYYAPLPKQEAGREYRFVWLGDYAVELFKIFFKLPIDATDFQSQPVMQFLNTGSDNLAYYGLDHGPLAVGEAYSLDLGYQKATDRLSTADMDVQPVEDLGSGIAGFPVQEYLPWVIGGLGLVLILVGVVYFASSRRGDRMSRITRKRHATARGEGASLEVTYCHQCGRRAQPGDQFCRACGVRLRREE